MISNSTRPGTAWIRALPLLLSLVTIAVGCSRPTTPPPASTTLNDVPGATAVGRPVPAEAALSRIEFRPGRAFDQIAGATRPGHASYHSFSGTAGQVVMLSFARRPSGMLALSVRGPDGVLLADAVPEAIIELPSEGEYQVDVVGSDTQYTLLATRSRGTTRAEPTPVEVGEGVTLNGTVAAGEIVQYAFQAEAGKDIAIRLTSPDGRFIPSLRQRNGAVLMSFAEGGYAGGPETVRRIPRSGEYVASILALGGIDGTSETSYEMRLGPGGEE